MSFITCQVYIQNVFFFCISRHITKHRWILTMLFLCAYIIYIPTVKYTFSYNNHISLLFTFHFYVNICPFPDYEMYNITLSKYPK